MAHDWRPRNLDLRILIHSMEQSFMEVENGRLNYHFPLPTGDFPLDDFRKCQFLAPPGYNLQISDWIVT